MPTTIKDLAKRLNLSVSTVSYALNGGPKPVSDDVRQRVLVTAKELNYRPNRLARSLVTRRSHVIGVIPPMIERDPLLGPFFQLALNGLVNMAEELHQDVMLLTAYDRTQPAQIAPDLMDCRVDGVVFIAPPKDNGAISLLRERGFPMAVVASAGPLVGPHFSADNEVGTFQALRHLYDLGHRRIAHLVGNLDRADAVVRHDTYLRFMREHRLTIEPGYMHLGNYVRHEGRVAARHFLNLPKRPTAVFCANDDSALGLIEGTRELGVSVPDELSVVGFDDTTLSASFLPPLTTIRQPIQQMSAAALAAVVAQAEGSPSPEGAFFATELVLRSSTHRPMEDQQP